jgi:LysM repeat protein
MDAHRRKDLVRVAAPLCFLLAATIAILLVRSGLHESAKQSPATTTVTKKRHAAKQRTIVPIAAGTTTTPAPATRTYTVASGDTLGSIATKEKTTVDALLAANPGIDPTGLQIGDKIRLP